jgi:hypothetical protein
VDPDAADSDTKSLFKHIRTSRNIKTTVSDTQKSIECKPGLKLNMDMEPDPSNRKKFIPMINSIYQSCMRNINPELAVKKQLNNV